MTFVPTKPPSSIKDVDSAVDLVKYLEAAKQAYAAGKAVSPYYEKYEKAKSYLEGLLDGDLRSITIKEITYDAALEVVSKILGEAAERYLILYAPYTEIAFNVAKAFAKIEATNAYFDRAVKTSETVAPRIKSALKNFEVDKPRFKSFVNFGNEYLLYLWMSRGYFTEANFRKNPQKIVREWFGLRAAGKRFDEARRSMDYLIAMMVYNEQVRSNVIMRYNTYFTRMDRLQNEGGLFGRSVSTIADSVNEMAYANRTGRNFGINELRRPFEDLRPEFKTMLQPWLGQDERFERAIAKICAP